MPYYPQSPAYYPAPDSVTDAMLANMPDGTVKGRDVGAGAGDPQNLAVLQLMRMVFPLGVILDFAGDVLPPYFLWPAGQAISRATYALLYAKIGTIHGVGDGSTTFNLPDYRGRPGFGRDDMNVTVAGRITNAISGIVGTTLGAGGGDQRFHGHGHTVSDPTHGHGIGDPGHAHSVYDPGHSHSYADGHLDMVGTGAGILTNQSVYSYNGYSINAAGTGIGIYGAGTGVYVTAAGTGVTVAANGSGLSQNMPPALIVNKILFAGA